MCDVYRPGRGLSVGFERLHGGGSTVLNYWRGTHATFSIEACRRHREGEGHLLGSVEGRVWRSPRYCNSLILRSCDMIQYSMGGGQGEGRLEVGSSTTQHSIRGTVRTQERGGNGGNGEGL